MKYLNKISIIPLKESLLDDEEEVLDKFTDNISWGRLVGNGVVSYLNYFDEIWTEFKNYNHIPPTLRHRGRVGIEVRPSPEDINKNKIYIWLFQYRGTKMILIGSGKKRDPLFCIEGVGGKWGYLTKKRYKSGGIYRAGIYASLYDSENAEDIFIELPRKYQWLYEKIKELK